MNDCKSLYQTVTVKCACGEKEIAYSWQVELDKHRGVCMTCITPKKIIE
jgi:hypothetical protein